MGRIAAAAAELTRCTLHLVPWQLEKHSSASDMVENLGPILEDDCDDFVSTALQVITDVPVLQQCRCRRQAIRVVRRSNPTTVLWAGVQDVAHANI